MERSIVKNLTFSGITILLFLIVLEVGVRLSGYGLSCQGNYGEHSVWACDPPLYCKQNPLPNVNGGGLNSAGFRTHEFGPKPAGTYRILALGDSCTFGITTTTSFQYIQAPYPQRLEELAAKRVGAGKVEVLNAGVPGYNSFLGVMLLRTRLRRLQPDLVTVRYGWNDHLMSRHVRGQAFHEPGNALLIGIQDLLLRTALYPSIRRFQLDLDTRRQAAGSARATSADIPHEWNPDVPLDEYKHNLGRIAEIVRGRGAEVWFLTSPHAFIIDENRGQYDKFPNAPSAKYLLTFNGIPTFDRLIEIHESYNAATREVGAELGVPVIDMDALYREHSSEHLFGSTDVPHPTQQGHDLEAEALYARLVAQGIVKPAPSASVTGN